MFENKRILLKVSGEALMGDMQFGLDVKTVTYIANEIKKVYSDPMSWWMSHEVQEARKKFCDQFARTSEKWCMEWKREILKLAKG